MKLCSRLFVLYCRNCSKDDKFRYFYPHFEEVRGGVEPWLMAHGKARVDFLLSVIGFSFLSLTVEAPQGKRCQDSLLSAGVGQFERRFQGKGSSPGILFGFCKTRRILLSDSANCTVLRAVVLTQYRRSCAMVPSSLYFPCNTITLGGTSKRIAFLGSGNDSDDYLLQPHFVRKKFFLIIFSCFI